MSFSLFIGDEYCIFNGIWVAYTKCQRSHQKNWLKQECGDTNFFFFFCKNEISNILFGVYHIEFAKLQRTRSIDVLLRACIYEGRSTPSDMMKRGLSRIFEIRSLSANNKKFMENNCRIIENFKAHGPLSATCPIFRRLKIVWRSINYFHHNDLLIKVIRLDFCNFVLAVRI